MEAVQERQWKRRREEEGELDDWMNDYVGGVNEWTMDEKVKRGAGWFIKFPASGVQNVWNMDL